MAKNSDSPKPRSLVPVDKPSVRHQDFMRAPGPSAKPPTRQGRSTGSLPQNRRKGS